MKFVAVAFSLICFLPNDVLASDDPVLDILNDFKVEGVHLDMTLTELQAVMSAYETDGMVCNHQQVPQRVSKGKSKATRPSQEIWTCLFQPADNPSHFKRLKVLYVHDEIKSIKYEGSVLPDVGGENYNAYLRAIDARFQSVSDLGDQYKFVNNPLIGGASDPTLSQSMDLSVDRKCKAVVKTFGPQPVKIVETSYKLGLKASYFAVPSQNHEGGTVEIFRDDSIKCHRFVQAVD